VSRAGKYYLILSALFIAALVSCNLIFQKFFVWHPFAFTETWSGSWASLTEFKFELSVGILPYPITFLITDCISEIYGRKRANQTVIAGFWAALFVLLIVTVANAAQATTWSPVDNGTFETVFGLTAASVGASMAAYLIAQLIDVRIYHFWKKVTKGKKLWLRNNFSTMASQLVDTATVLLLLCACGVIEWSRFSELFVYGFLFKIIVALFDTPLLYLFTFFLRKKLHLKMGEEVQDVRF
jgi:uncharacterized integral membrane protein (TIGR00697 family)